ncbi:MAG: molybdate ABC transporter substrate-binding protein [Bacillota bacterium]|nr:molybdate ABC transporter substrate-binding protein [Bacillota bacterium]
MKKITSMLLTLFITMSLFAGCSKKQAEVTPKAQQVNLTVLAAASMTDVLKDLQKDYETANPNVKLTFSFASSGALQTQIEQGAPADVFVSAATKQMTALKDKNLMVNDSIIKLLKNKVVLVVPANGTSAVANFEDAATDKVKKIALGEPKSVPAGQYAEDVFTSLKVLDKVKAKAVYGDNVRTVLTYVESGNADCGVVYATDAATTTKVKVVCEAPKGSCKDIIYPAGIVKASKNQEASQAFLKFLQSDTAAAKFEKYGFVMVK